MKFVKIFKLDDSKNGISFIPFEKLRAGDVFYSERKKDDLEVGPEGKFIMVAITDPQKTDPPGNYGLTIEYIA